MYNMNFNFIKPIKDIDFNMIKTEYDKKGNNMFLVVLDHDFREPAIKFIDVVGIVSKFENNTIDVNVFDELPKAKFLIDNKDLIEGLVPLVYGNLTHGKPENLIFMGFEVRMIKMKCTD